jgi:hypothetical protein
VFGSCATTFGRGGATSGNVMLTSVLAAVLVGVRQDTSGLMPRVTEFIVNRVTAPRRSAS